MKSKKFDQLKNIASVVGGILLLQLIGVSAVVLWKFVVGGVEVTLESVPHSYEVLRTSMLIALAVGCGVVSYYFGCKAGISKKSIIKTIMIFLVISLAVARLGSCNEEYPKACLSHSAEKQVVLFMWILATLLTPYLFGFSKKKKQN